MWMVPDRRSRACSLFSAASRAPASASPAASWRSISASSSSLDRLPFRYESSAWTNPDMSMFQRRFRHRNRHSLPESRSRRRAVRARPDTRVGRELEQVDLFFGCVECIITDHLLRAQVDERLPLGPHRPPLQLSHASFARSPGPGALLSRAQPQLVFASEYLD